MIPTVMVMNNTIAKRLLQLIPTLFGISLLSFLLVYLSPGDPAELLMRQSGGQPTREAIEAFREKLGMNDSILVRYARWLKQAATLDFGASLSTGEDVLSEIKRRLPATFKLALAAFLFVLAVSIPWGTASGLLKDKSFDHISRLAAILSISLPSFWLGLLLLALFAVQFKIFRVVGHETLKDLVLPAVTLGLYPAAVYSRLLRERIIEAFSQDYIKLARAKGLSMFEIVRRHALKNALLPLVTMWGVSFGYLLGGSIIVESLFSWPGVGKMAVDAIGNRDFPVLQCYVLIMALIFVAMNLIVDLIYHFLDPRIKSGGRES